MSILRLERDVEMINTCTKLVDPIYDLLADPRRYFIMEGSLLRQATRKMVSRWCMIFNDVLVITKRLNRLEAPLEMKCQMKQVIELRHLRLDETPQKNHSFSHSITLICPLISYTLGFDSAEEKKLWVNAITRAVRVLLTDELVDVDHADTNVRVITSPFARPSPSSTTSHKTMRIQEYKPSFWHTYFHVGTLHWACATGEYRVVLQLCQNGQQQWNIDEFDLDGYSPLYFALTCGDEDIAMLLLSYGGNTSLQDKYGRFPLHLAAIGGYVDTIVSLVERKADVNAQDRRGRNALWYCCMRANSRVAECVTLLCELGANPDSPNASGISLLQLCCRHNRIVAVLPLLQAKASVNMWDELGCTPLHYASALSNTDMVLSLLQYGAQVNVGDNERNTCLHMADDLETALLLIEHGARRDLVNVHEVVACQHLLEMRVRNESGYESREYIKKARLDIVNRLTQASVAYMTQSDVIGDLVLSDRDDWMTHVQADSCVLCQLVFDKHRPNRNCYRCGIMICGDCCTHSFIHFSLKSSQPQSNKASSLSPSGSTLRCCDSCYNVLKYKNEATRQRDVAVAGYQHNTATRAAQRQERQQYNLLLQEASENQEAEAAPSTTKTKTKKIDIHVITTPPRNIGRNGKFSAFVDDDDDEFEEDQESIEFICKEAYADTVGPKHEKPIVSEDTEVAPSLPALPPPTFVNDNVDDDKEIINAIERIFSGNVSSIECLATTPSPPTKFTLPLSNGSNGSENGLKGLVCSHTHSPLVPSPPSPLSPNSQSGWDANGLDNFNSLELDADAALDNLL